MGGSQLPDQGLNPPPPASGGEVSTTELPGKSLLLIFYCSPYGLSDVHSASFALGLLFIFAFISWIDPLPAEPQGKPKKTGVGSLSLMRET